MLRLIDNCYDLKFSNGKIQHFYRAEKYDSRKFALPARVFVFKYSEARGNRLIIRKCVFSQYSALLFPPRERTQMLILDHIKF